MIRIVLCVWLCCHCLVLGGNRLQVDTTTRFDLLKSLVLANSRTTVTLDSAAMQKLDQLSLRGTCFVCKINYVNMQVNFVDTNIIMFTWNLLMYMTY